MNLLGQAENALGRLQGSVGRMVNPYLIARPLLRREAILSSRMEGTRDGNRRVGHLLIPLTLLAHGRMSTPTLYVSGSRQAKTRPPG